MKRVPTLYLAPERQTIGDIPDGVWRWAFHFAIRVDTEGSVWIDRGWTAHRFRLPGMVGIRRDGDQYHVRLPRRRYSVGKPPRLGDEEWVPAASVKMFWSVAALLGF